jgi:hypothetical protein
MIAIDRALSIRGPWWWFILHGGKTIENRNWNTNFRGPFLVHASTWFRRDLMQSDLDMALEIAQRTGVTLPPVPSLDDFRAMGGHVVGQATVVGCVTQPVAMVLRVSWVRLG